MTPIKFFNFALPFDTYQELKQLAVKMDIPIAAIVRTAIDRHLAGATKNESNDKA